MSFEAIAVANRLIDIAAENGAKVNPLKVQKLVYFAHGWNLALVDAPLIRERVEAWKYGPVVSDLYHALKEYGAGPIPCPITVLRLNENSEHSVSLVRPTLEAENCGPGELDQVQSLLRQIWSVYGKYSATVLSNATHFTALACSR